MPADAVQDKYEYMFVYEKAGVKKEFQASALPDSTWKYADRKQTLVQKGYNNVPLISDFSLTAADGTDATSGILNSAGDYYLFFLKTLPTNSHKWIEAYKVIVSKAASENKKMYVITAQREQISQFLTEQKLTVDAVFTCDATALKTVARANPTLYLMKGPVVQNKWSWADLDAVTN